eukprot:1748757-Amphidinium_carterae.1
MCYSEGLAVGDVCDRTMCEDPKITHHYETVLDEMRAAASRSRPKSTFSHTRTRSAPQPAESVPSQQEQAKLARNSGQRMDREGIHQTPTV